MQMTLNAHSPIPGSRPALRDTYFKRLRFSALAGFIALSACGLTVVFDRDYTVVPSDATVKYKLKGSEKLKADLPAGGLIHFIFENLPVKAGESLETTVQMSVPEGRLDLFLMAHCGVPNDPEFTKTHCMASNGSQSCSISHQYSQDFECVRTSIHNPTSQPITVNISKVTIKEIPD